MMGVRLPDRSRDRDNRAVHKAVLSWTKKNYAWLREYNAKIGEACLVEDARYDAEHRRIIKTWPADRLRRKPHEVVFEVNPRSREVPTTDLGM